MSPSDLKKELRFGQTRFLRNRRLVIGSGLGAGAALGLITLYQTGILKRLPGPRSGIFHAEKVNGSEQAYALFQTPDAVLGLGSYAGTILLAAMGPADRASSAPWIPFAMGAKALGDAIYVGKRSVEQWTRYRSFSVWSLIAAGATMVMLRFALPEAAEAVKSLRDG